MRYCEQCGSEYQDSITQCSDCGPGTAMLTAAEMKAKGKIKPVVVSLAGDVEVEEAAQYLYENGIPAYAYSTELPVEVLGAKYQWARAAGLL
jgi:acyl-CoA synthetase (NDP forming)